MNRHFVYVLTLLGEPVSYVGITKRLRDRMAAHRRRWRGRPMFVSLLEAGISRPAALRAERSLITQIGDMGYDLWNCQHGHTNYGGTLKEVGAQ